MSDRFDRERGRRPYGPPGRRPRSAAEFDDEDEDMVFDEASGRDEEPPRRRPRDARPGGRPARGRTAARPAAGWGLFGSKSGPGGRPRRPERVDWESLEDDEYDDRDARPRRRPADSYDDDEEVPARRRAPAREEPRRRLTLMDLCTPVFGYAAILPREAGGVHPGYQQFRQEALAALQKVESEARDHGIDLEDAREATYALSLFMDEQVAESEWSGKPQWASEPLNMVRVSDPEGGINFFNHLDRLGERQRAVKRVYLVCLALGFRGKFAELEPAQQAARVGEIKQKVLRSIQEPLEVEDVLFPEAYEPAVPLEGQVPPAPRTWWLASLGTCVVLLFLWLILFYFAGRLPERAEEGLRTHIEHGEVGRDLGAERGASADNGAAGR